METLKLVLILCLSSAFCISHYPVKSSIVSKLKRFNISKVNNSKPYSFNHYYYEMKNDNVYKITDNILGKSLHLFEEDEFDAIFNKKEMREKLLAGHGQSKDNIVEIESDYSFMNSYGMDGLEEDLDDWNEHLDDANDFQDDIKVSHGQYRKEYNFDSNENNMEDTDSKGVEHNVETYFKGLNLDFTNSKDAKTLSELYYAKFIKRRKDLHEKMHPLPYNFETSKAIRTNSSAQGIRNEYIREFGTQAEPSTYKHSSPLFLTPYAYTSNSVLGQSLSEVKPFVGNIKSYSGYLTVDSRYHSNLFFWFFRCQRPDHLKKPLLLWLQGGPGASSLFGLFYENGPYEIIGKRIHKSENSWTKLYNVLYIDSPVGTGFSFTTKDGYARNQTIVGQHLYEALKQFFLLFPELKENSFYITGESYAGKYIPALAYEIHTRNVLAHSKINLKGLFIGNGLIDPISMLEYNEFLFDIGLLDKHQKKFFAKIEQRIALSIRSKQWKRASQLMAKLFFHTGKVAPWFQRMTGFTQHYNLNGIDFSTKDFNNFIQDSAIRNALHVGEMKFNPDDEVFNALFDDIMKSTKPLVNILVENYKLVLYYGQLDIICAYRLSEAFFHSIQFTHAHDYYLSERKVWRCERDDDQDNVVGYIREAHNFVEALIRNAGHMVPRDKPEVMMDLLKKYIQ